MSNAKQYKQLTEIIEGTTAESNLKLSDVVSVQHTDTATGVNTVNKIPFAYSLCIPVAVTPNSTPSGGAYTATCVNYPDFSLTYTDKNGNDHYYIGLKVRVVFTTGINYGSVSGGTYPTLNVNGSGSIPLLAQGLTMGTGAVKSGQTVELTIIPYGNGVAFDADLNIREATTDYTIYTDGIQRVDEVVSNSKNMVTSGGVKTALDNFQSKSFIPLVSNDADIVDDNIYNCYCVGGGCANIPVARIGLLTSYKYVSGQYIRITQEYSTNDDAVSTAEKYIRWGMSNNSGTSYTWTAWKKIVVSPDITPTINNSLLQFNSGYSIVDGDIILSSNLLILNICIQRTTTGTGSEIVATLQKTPLSYINSFIGVGGRYTVTGVGYVFISSSSKQMALDFNGQSYAKLNIVLPVS